MDLISYSLIPQRFSWGQLQITKEAFETLFTRHRIFSAFLNVVQEFGSRVRDGCPKRHLFSSRPDHGVEHPSDNAGLWHSDYGPLCDSVDLYWTNLAAELSYLIRFMEENGRSRGNPWSLRQIGVYQKVNFRTGRSVWIILQLSGTTRSRMNETVQGKAACHESCGGPLRLHATLLLATVGNWADYIEFLHSRLRRVVS
jgi:hypothetical protein